MITDLDSFFWRSRDLNLLDEELVLSSVEYFQGSCDFDLCLNCLVDRIHMQRIHGSVLGRDAELSNTQPSQCLSKRVA